MTHTTETFTPGPWTYHGGYIRHGDTYLAETLVGPDCEEVSTVHANARLIAAAPALYAALEFAVEACQQQSRMGKQAPMILSAMEGGLRALAAADGKEAQP